MNQLKIGSFLRELRKEKGITQEELASKLMVSNRSVSRWENGVNMPDFDLLLEISKLYEVGIDELLNGERKSENMDKTSEETMIKVAEYTNLDKEKYIKRMNRMLITGIFVMLIALYIDINEIEGIIFSFIKGLGFGAGLGMLIVQAIFTSKYGEKIRAEKMRLLNKIKLINK